MSGWMDRLWPEPVDPIGPSGKVEYRLPIVCTDRGQHDPVVITYAIRDANGWHHLTDEGSHANPNGVAAPGALSRASHTFICSECPRRPRIKPQRFWDETDQRVRVGFDQFDISGLPL